MRTQPPPADEADATRPAGAPTSLRHPQPKGVFLALPQLNELICHPPAPGETSIAYLRRLAGSTTPEEAVTYTAFAAAPKMAIWWAYECLRQSHGSFDDQERELMRLVATWAGHPSDANRFRTMQVALYSPLRGPVLQLALAVGWSGGPVAPNDPTPVAPHRAPKAINAAVLSGLSRGPLAQRTILLARFVRLAEPLHAPH